MQHPSRSQMRDIPRWLDEIGLGQYGQAFLQNDIDFEVLPDLTESDLEKLGLSLGHRKKLLRAIAAMQTSPVAGLPQSTPVEAAGAPPSLTMPAARPEPERRQLTVMFCDLVGSTALSARLDPEEMREILRAYQNAVAGEVARFDGHVAKFMGDGALAYFGWPRAHEDDAERAVRSSLASIEAVAGLRTATGESLAARIGIATGLVVVWDLIGEGAAQEETVVGETPNLAARLQAAAEPGAVVVGETTRRLLGDLFELDDLGPQDLKGIDRPVRAFRVVREDEAESRFDARQGGTLLPMVGRDQELALLLERWRQAVAGEGQLVLLSGEAGIGKSRITRAMRDALMAEPHLRIRWQCSPYHADSALYPVIQQFVAAAGFTDQDPTAQKLDKLETLLGRAVSNAAEVAPVFAAMLSLPADGRYPPLDLTPQQLRTRTLQALVDQLLGLARRRPVLFILEDLHWVDPTTLELLQLVVDTTVGARVLTLVTTRPFTFAGFGGHSHVTRLTLNRLGREPTAAIVGRLTGGKSLPEEVMTQILAKTDGMPLFVEELTKTVLESGLLREMDEAFVLTGPLPPMAIPASLHDSLMARLDRLAPIREVVQTAAVIGREFSHRLLSAVSPLREPELQAALGRVVEAELIHRRGVPPDAIYAFKHALVRDAAYESLLRSTRQLLHARIMDVLEQRFPDTPPEVIARHAEEAGAPEKAVGYWQQAGESAWHRSANAEAITHLKRCLALLATLPDREERVGQELTVQITLGSALIVNWGYASPEVRPTYARALELARRIGEPAQILPASYGWWVVHFIGGQHRKALEIAEEFLRLARPRRDAALLAALRAVGWSSLCLGRPTVAEECCAEVEAIHDPQEHRPMGSPYGADLGATTLGFGSWAAWLLGYRDRAVERSRRGLVLARNTSHPLSLAYSLGLATGLQLMRGDADEARRYAEECIALCTKHDIRFWRAWPLIPLGWSEAEAGRLERGIALVQEGLSDLLATGASTLRPLGLTVLAELQARAGWFDEALAAVGEALTLALATGEACYEPEMHRVRGELLLRHGTPAAEAEACFMKSIDVARQQACRILELRGAVSLAGLWLEQGRPAEAHDLLAPIYGWFTEGLDSRDLVDAKSLLDRTRTADHRVVELL